MLLASRVKSLWGFLYITLVKCHVQTAARLISVSHFHALLKEAGIAHESARAPCADTFLWRHPPHSDKSEKCVSHISHAVSSYMRKKEAKKPLNWNTALNSNRKRSWQDLRCNCGFQHVTWPLTPDPNWTPALLMLSTRIHIVWN